jgi:hypothetical protein
MQLGDAIERQPEHSSVVYDHGSVMLQRTVVLEDGAVDEAFSRIPWGRLVFLKCDRQQGGKRVLLYRWRPETGGWR